MERSEHSFRSFIPHPKGVPGAEQVLLPTQLSLRPCLAPVWLGSPNSVGLFVSSGKAFPEDNQSSAAAPSISWSLLFYSGQCVSHQSPHFESVIKWRLRTVFILGEQWLNHELEIPSDLFEMKQSASLTTSSGVDVQYEPFWLCLRCFLWNGKRFGLWLRGAQNVFISTISSD